MSAQAARRAETKVKLKRQKRVIVGLVVAILATLLLGCGSEEVDVTLPVISEIAVSDITENSATITWSTDELAEGYLKYRCYFEGPPGGLGGLTLFATRHADESTFHIVVLEELPSGKPCWFQVSAHDATGNIATSEEMSFTTATEGDC